MAKPSSVRATCDFDAAAPTLARRCIDWEVDGGLLGGMVRKSLHLPLYGIHVASAPSATSENVDALRRIILARAGSRARFYICGECGDPGCGVVTGAIDFEGEIVRVAHFRLEYHYGPKDVEVVHDPGLRSIAFRAPVEDLWVATLGLDSLGVRQSGAAHLSGSES